MPLFLDIWILQSPVNYAIGAWIHRGCTLYAIKLIRGLVTFSSSDWFDVYWHVLLGWTRQNFLCETSACIRIEQGTLTCILMITEVNWLALFVLIGVVDDSVCWISPINRKVSKAIISICLSGNSWSQIGFINGVATLWLAAIKFHFWLDWLLQNYDGICLALLFPKHLCSNWGCRPKTVVVRRNERFAALSNLIKVSGEGFGGSLTKVDDHLVALSLKLFSWWKCQQFVVISSPQESLVFFFFVIWIC